MRQYVIITTCFRGITYVRVQSPRRWASLIALEHNDVALHTQTEAQNLADRTYMTGLMLAVISKDEFDILVILST